MLPNTLGLLTDLYQITMAAGYWKTGLAERQTVFSLFFRENPFGNGFSLACGLEAVIDLLGRFRFGDDDLAYLAEQLGNDGRPLFDAGFLAYLKRLELTCDLDALPEGTAVFPREPMLRIRGPLLQCQLLETPLLTLLNFATLIATKAARVCRAAAGDAVLEFGLRRAQGPDGGVTASRAAYVGGCVGTSNVLAGKLYAVPVMGTHAHSWVMSFESEPEAFEAWARALPNNCIFLVDTWDTLEGVSNAIRAAEDLRRRGHEMIGVRLDSGDLAALSVAARRRLDEAGFPDARIVASGDLDEHRIRRLKAAGARIDVWGVGTRLATAYDQPALGGVYKLTDYRDASGVRRPVMKLSEETFKSTDPGIQQVRRFRDDGGGFLADVIYDEPHGLDEPPRRVDAAGREHAIPSGAEGEDLLVPVVRGGRAVYRPPAIAAVRERALAQIAALPEGVRRLDDPAVYPVGLDPHLHRVKEDLVAKLRSAQCNPRTRSSWRTSV